MTEKLKNLLHDQATTVDFALPDLDAITATGDRRIRRRRATGLAGGLAALAMVGGVAIVALGGDDGTPRVADEPFPATPLSWADGSTFHAGDLTRDVGHEVAAYVVTRHGYVFADDDGTVWSFVAGRVEEVGTVTSRSPRLVGDTDGALVGWVDPSGEVPAFVVLDTSTGRTTTLQAETTAGMGSLADEEDPAYFYAIDGSTAYLRDHRGAVGVDVTAGEVVWRDRTARNGFDVITAEDGLVALDAGDDGTTIEGGAEPVTLRQVYGSMGAFSASGRWLSLDADEPEVYDARTGRRIRIDVGSRAFGTGYAWIDDATLVVLAAQAEAGPVELLTCTVPDGTCTQAARFGDFEEFAETVVLSFGEGFES